MPGAPAEKQNKDSSYSLFEQDCQIREWLQKDKASRNHQQHVHFGNHVPDGVNGHPHHITGWLGGVLTNLGFRRP